MHHNRFHYQSASPLLTNLNNDDMNLNTVDTDSDPERITFASNRVNYIQTCNTVAPQKYSFGTAYTKLDAGNEITILASENSTLCSSDIKHFSESFMFCSAATKATAGLECRICQDRPIDIVLKECGHCFCETCILELLTNDHKELCPLCRKRIFLTV